MASPISTGLTAASTSGSGWTSALVVPSSPRVPFFGLVIINAGSGNGWFRTNGGAPCRLPPPNAGLNLADFAVPGDIEIMREGSTNIDALHIFTWQPRT